MSFTGCNKAKDVLNTRVCRGPEAPEARGARNRRGVHSYIRFTLPIYPYHCPLPMTSLTFVH